MIRTRPLSSLRAGALALALLALNACTTEIYHELDERSANEMIVALERHGISAQKGPDENVEGAWTLSVGTADRVDAWQVLQNQGLPRPAVKGFESHYPSAGLIPTSSEERIVLQFSTSQEMRRTLLTVDRVVDAQVNLVLPEKPRVPMPNQVIEKPRCSVLVKYRVHEGGEATPPLSNEQVAELVAGGVEALEISHVTVIQTPEHVSTQAITSPRFAQVGPIAVAPQSKAWMQLLLGVLSLTVVFMGAVIAFLLIRRRVRPEASQA